jgi:maltose alpha-D-glucosyltransferase/alpha-amylase
MQWSDERNGGFSDADPQDLVRPVVSGGEYGYESVNVADQRGDPDSLLQWFSRLNRLRSECPEIGHGDCEVLETGDAAVFAHRMVSDHGRVVAVHNLGEAATEATVELAHEPARLLGDAELEKTDAGYRFELSRYDHCWVRVEEGV